MIIFTVNPLDNEQVEELLNLPRRFRWYPVKL